MYPLGQNAFISYRGDHVEQARLLKQRLEQNGFCRRAVLFEPDQLSVGGEALLPYEFVELMEFITDQMARCDSLVYLATEDYGQSYFTQAELLQWRRFKQDPRVYAAIVGEDGEGGISDAIPLEPMSADERKLWAKFSVGINRSMQGHLSPAFLCGRFAKSCFLVPCRGCGEHFLVTRNFMREALEGKRLLRCPHKGCGAANFRVGERASHGTFYRKPITIEQPRAAPVRVLDSRELLNLLLTNDQPPQFPVLHREGEKLRSDGGKLGIFYAGLAAAVGLGLFLAAGDD